ncbi:MAG: hypothetical protein ACN6OI_22360 [Flavobacterium sp.]|uniref:hypothetical protein n=1 Tax=Flavobacterium sp. TaxID=239 RepID=UPI003D0BD462
MHKFIKYSVCFFIALFLLSCSNDVLEKNQENVKTVTTDLELSKFSNPNIAQNVEVDFENVNVIEKDDFKISEFLAKEKVVNTFESDVLQNHLKYQGVTIESEGKSQSYFLEVFTLAKSAVYPETITNLKDFTGGLNVYSFDGENLGSVVVRNGKAANVSGKNELDVLTKTINLFYAPSDITSKIPLCKETYTQTVWLTQDVWRIISNGSKILEVIYVGEKVTKTTNTVPYPCESSGDVEAIKLQRIAHIANYDQNGKYIGEISEEDYPPSCHSFNFIVKLDANWQEALVKNIRFKIVLLNERGVEIVHAISYPQAVSFGAPIVNRFNTTYSAGVAADVAAKAVKESMQNVVDKYGRTRVSDLVLDQYFKERLIHNYQYYQDGGRVQFNSTSSTPATEYKTTLLWSDDCILD